MKRFFLWILRGVVIALPWSLFLNDKPFWIYLVISVVAILAVQLLVELERREMR